MAIFTDPEIQRLSSIEDWLAVSDWRKRGEPDDSKPVPIALQVQKSILARERAKNKKPGDVIDVRAEIAARQRGEKPTAKPRKPNPEAQRIRAAIAERQAAAAQ